MKTRINVSSSLDTKLVHGAIVEALSGKYYEIVNLDKDIKPGEQVKERIVEIMHGTDIFIFIIGTLTKIEDDQLKILSKTLVPLAQENKKIAIPFVREGAELPIELSDTKAIYYNNQNISDQIDQLRRTVVAFRRKREVLDRKSKIVNVKSQKQISDYIEIELEKLRSQAGKFEISYRRWFSAVTTIGLVNFSLILAYSVYLIIRDPQVVNLPQFLMYGSRGAIVLTASLILLHFMYKIANLNRNEFLRINDRIHAINFAKFLLQAFPDNVDRHEVRDLLNTWNIERAQVETKSTETSTDPRALLDIIEKIIPKKQ